MALSDCIKCWETPCTCGYEYQQRTFSKNRKLINAIAKHISKDELIRIRDDINNAKLNKV